MEYLDILDEEGNPTGKIASRDEVHQKGLRHKSVHVWIVNSHKQLLVQKRNPNRKNHPNMWDVSCAGHVEAGSSSLESAIREAEEELSLSVQPEELQYLFTVKIEKPLTNGTYFSKGFCDIFILNKNIDPKNLHLQKEEVTEVKCIDIDRLETLHRSPDFVPREEEFLKLAKFLSGDKI